MYQKLLKNLGELKLEKMCHYLPGYLDAISKKDISTVDTLHHLTEKKPFTENQKRQRLDYGVHPVKFNLTGCTSHKQTVRFYSGV